MHAVDQECPQQGQKISTLFIPSGQRGHIRYILWTFFVPAVSATDSGVLVLYQVYEAGNAGTTPHFRSLLDN